MVETAFNANEKAINEIGYIKIVKNTKGYNWEIKVYENMDIEKMRDLKSKLNILNTEMIEQYGIND